MDGHAKPIQPELIELGQVVVEHGNVEAIILERDANFPGSELMEEELSKLRRIFERN